MTQWLRTCCILVVVMIFLGGLTRLTDSGLSIVEWKPVTGVIPPLNDTDWQLEFTKYQTFPEYQKLKQNIQLQEFKFIFWLEFIHRLLGRVTGLVYLLPFIYFWFKEEIRAYAILPYVGILVLFLLQGFMGWYMVKSGLINQPYVSHIRLGLHLILAIFIYHLLFYQLMKNSFDILLTYSKINFKKINFWCVLSLTAIYIQIFLGALVAGLDAGLVYNTFPLMGGSFIPGEINLGLISSHNWQDPVFVQFIHRNCAYLFCIIIITLFISLLKANHPKLTRTAYYIILALLSQVVAGIIVVLYSVPIIMALIHQLGAILLLSLVLWCYFLVRSV